MTDDSIVIALPRVGKDGKIINVYKFRTMVPGAQHLQALVYSSHGLDMSGKFRDDPRITPFGKILRKYWLDEIPMIVNVIKGDMKLVGVRPISEHYFSLYDDEVQRRRIQYKPGLIPPYYADNPKGLDEIQESEMRYFDSYDRNPIGTDLQYVIRIIFNVMFKATCSK